MSKRPRLGLTAQELMHVSESECGGDVNEEDIFGCDDEPRPDPEPRPSVGPRLDGYEAAAEAEEEVAQKFGPMQTGGMLDIVRAAGVPVPPNPLGTVLGFQAFDLNLRARRGIASAVVKMPWERWPFNMVLCGAVPSCQKLLVDKVPPRPFLTCRKSRTTWPSSWRSSGRWRTMRGSSGPQSRGPGG